ncbi:zinc-dependent alcohol dehydrogenase [Halosimplex amylolyticum]|uniref:zinc-dependent alcohol dehydrogenase n=1 Tax=Halosimplex amylolyticum TaxID=3396616 RepID=UPI003F54DBE0
MKKVEITGEREAAIVDVPEPEPVEDWVKVRVEAAPMCTEYHTWEAGHSGLMGHEAAGEVAAVDQPSDVEVGDRVVVMPQTPCGTCELCRSGDYIYCENNHDYEEFTGQETGNETMSQYVLKQDWLLVPIPDGVSYTHAGMACCGLGPTYGANERMNVSGVDTVLISGAGPVGLGGVINTTHRGAQVIVSEPNEFRADLARELGADAVVNPLEDGKEEIKALTDGAGVDKAIECTGLAPAQRFAIDALGRRGELTFVGEGGELEINVSNDMLRNGLDLHGQWHYNRGLAPGVMSVIQANEDKLETFITHEFPMGDVNEAFELQSEQETGKVVLHPWE